MKLEKIELNKENLSGIAYVIWAYLAWGFLPLYWKALHQVPPEHILANRILWSFVFAVGLIAFTRRWSELKKAFSHRKTILGLILGSLLISGNWYTYIWAVNSEKIVETSLGYYINPLLTVLLGMVVLRERLDLWQGVSLALATVGVAIITVEYGRLPWVALILASSFALYGLCKRLVKLDSTMSLALETLFVLPPALLFIIRQGFTGTSSLAETGWLVMVLLMGTGVVTALPLLWFAEGAKRVSFTTLGFIQYLSPTISLFLGVFVFHEPFSKMHLLSFGFIWSALALYSFTRTGLLDARAKAVER